MVQLSILSLCLFAAAAFATPVKRTVAQVEADIATMSSQVTSLNNQIQAFPNSGGSLTNALAIFNAAAALDRSITQGTTDVQNTGVFSESDGRTIPRSVQAVQPTIISALDGIASKRAAFDGLPMGGISGLVKQYLAALGSDTMAFENALITNAPPDLESTAHGIANAINAAIDNAQAAYANA
uniref:Putative hydrophobic surface binding protein n=1 Tax=Moniliophthora roreri TaxID=221103 RepID=A0A0W0GD58_MONRR